jgi:hypothetical protein
MEVEGMHVVGIMQSESGDEGSQQPWTPKKVFVAQIKEGSWQVIAEPRLCEFSIWASWRWENVLGETKPHVLFPSFSRRRRPNGKTGAAVGAGLQLSILATDCVGCGNDGKAAAEAIAGARKASVKSVNVMVFPCAPSFSLVIVWNATKGSSKLDNTMCDEW